MGGCYGKFDLEAEIAVAIVPWLPCLIFDAPSILQRPLVLGTRR